MTMLYRWGGVLLTVVALSVFISWRVERALAWHLPVSWITKPISVSGRVLSASTTGHLLRFRLHSQIINHQTIEQNIQLSWFYPEHNLLSGQLCSGVVSLKPVHHLKNPQTLWMRRWLARFRYRAQGYIKSNQWHCMAQQPNLRLQLLRRIQQIVRLPDLTGAIAALAVGIQSGLSQADWQVLRHTGTSHLLAISGLHLGLVLWMSYQLMFWLWRRSAKLCLRYPAPRVAALFALLMMTLYGLLSGFSLPTQRAWIMNGLWVLSLLLPLSIAWHWRLLMAGLAIVIWQPWSVLSVSYWLSFSAVAWMAFSLSQIKPMNVLRLQALMTLGLLPITLYFFSAVSWSALLANSVAIPWVSFIVVPIVLLASVLTLLHMPYAVGLFNLAAYGLWPLWQFLHWLSASPYLYQSFYLLHGWHVLALWFFLVWLLLPFAWVYRAWAVMGVAAVLCARPKPVAKDDVTGVMLDVGQGLSVVIRTAHHVLVYDTGPRYASGFDAGSYVVVPYLQSMHINKVDAVVISHGDNDHIGGLRAVLSAIPVATVMTSVPASKFKSRFLQPILPCYSGQHWNWDGVEFDMLYPPKGLAYQANNSSCVLRITAHKQHILLTGDIERQGERWLLVHQRQQLPAEILQVPHHGSRTSSSEAFLQAVHPMQALISSGFYNRFHFPSVVVVKRYRHLDCHITNTAHQGAIAFKVGER